MTPARVTRHRRIKVILALAAVLSLVGLLGAQRRDDAWLLTLGGRPIDAWGALHTVAVHALRACQAVDRLRPDEAEARAALQALREFSPPDSHSARLLQVDRFGAWMAVQASFDALEPVVVLMHTPGHTPGHASGSAPEVVAEGVWSGPTRPWNAAWRIRGFLAERVPPAPAALLRCLDPVPVFSGPPRPPA